MTELDRGPFMKARVMISSVVKDIVPLGNTSRLRNVWHDPDGLIGRLRAAGYEGGTDVSFGALRPEIARHLTNKYSFEVYIFEDLPGEGRPPAEETVLEATNSDLVIGIFGSLTGWPVPDQDPLTPTLREWRAVLQTPLKFRVFWLKGSVKPASLPGDLGKVLQQLAEYKTGKTFTEFSDACDLFVKIDREVQFYINRAVKKYVSDILAKEPGSESEDWLLSDYRSRHQKMISAFGRVANSLQIGSVWPVNDHKQPVSLNCVPDSFSIPESRKFAAYVFDTEAENRTPGSLGKLHFIAAFGGITDAQIRRHIGNIEGTEIYKGAWGFFASEAQTGIQCVYLPHCTSSLIMQSRLSQAQGWLPTRIQKIRELADRRQQILDLIGATTLPRPKPVRGTRVLGTHGRDRLEKNR